MDWRLSPSKERLVARLRNHISDFDQDNELFGARAVVEHYTEGHFRELLQIFENTENRAQEVHGTCYKELGRFDDAIGLLKQYPHNDIFCTSKTQLACTYILVGLEDEASKIIETIDFDGDVFDGLSLSEIGRAYFDVGSYNKCRTFFGRLSACDSVYPCFSFLDSICKMLILNDVEEIDGLKEFLIALLKLDDEIGTGLLKFLTAMLFCCCFIREEEYEKAKWYAKEILEEQKKNPSHENCFREPLLFSKYLKLRKEYRQALATLKIVEFLRKGLNIVEKPTLNGIEIEIQRDIEFCANRLAGDSQKK